MNTPATPANVKKAVDKKLEDKPKASKEERPKKPFVRPKHLTQRIQDDRLEQLSKELKYANHPAGKGRKRSGGRQ